VVPTNCAPKPQPDGERLTTVPVPESDTLCGLPEALSVMVSVPVRDPMAEGINVTLIEQLAPAATLVPQPFVWAKSPLTAMLEMLSAMLPVFVRVIEAAVVVLTS